MLTALRISIYKQNSVDLSFHSPLFGTRLCTAVSPQNSGPTENVRGTGAVVYPLLTLLLVLGNIPGTLRDGLSELNINTTYSPNIYHCTVPWPSGAPQTHRHGANVDRLRLLRRFSWVSLPTSAVPALLRVAY